MSNAASLLDLFDLDANTQRVFRIIMRSSGLAEQAVFDAARLQGLAEQEVGEALSTLTERGLIRRTTDGMTLHYRAFPNRRPPSLHAGAQPDLFETAEGRTWRPAMTTAPPSQDNSPVDPLLQRGGKKKLPSSIWDALE